MIQAIATGVMFCAPTFFAILSNSAQILRPSSPDSMRHCSSALARSQEPVTFEDVSNYNGQALI